MTLRTFNDRAEQCKVEYVIEFVVLFDAEDVFLVLFRYENARFVFGLAFGTRHVGNVLLCEGCEALSAYAMATF